MFFGVCNIKGRPQGAFLKSGRSKKDLMDRAKEQTRAELEFPLISNSSVDVIIKHAELTDDVTLSPADPQVLRVLRITGWPEK